MANKIIRIILFSLIIIHPTFAQDNKIDSLLIVLQTTNTDTNRVNICANISEAYRNSNADSAIYFAKLGLKIATKTNHKPSISKCYYNLGVATYYQGAYEEAIPYFLKSLKIAKELGNKSDVSKCYMNIGITQYSQGAYDKAISYFLASLKIAEIIHEKTVMSKCYMNMGNIYADQGAFDKSIGYYIQSLKIAEALDDKLGMSNCFTNIGNVKAYQENYDDAIAYFLKSLKINEEIGDNKGMSSCFNNIGIVYTYLGDYEKATSYFLKTLKIVEELGDKNGIAMVWINIADMHIANANLMNTNSVERTKHYNEAVNFALKSIELSREIKALPLENKAAHNLMEAFQKLGKFKESLEYAQFFISTQDSMFKNEKTKALAEMGTKYESEKKQLEIEKLGKEKELQHSENKKQRLTIWFIALGLVLVIVFAGVIYNRFRITKQQKIIIENQKELVDIKNQEITDSINYAKRIQEAILPTYLFEKEFGNNAFILYKPKDIVSGDFYWLEKSKNSLLVAAVDCTGHGVPGAFMSIVGYNMLNQTVNEHNITQPNLILNELNKGVTDTLRQSKSESIVKDGMDINLCSINYDTLELQYSGAYNPLWIIREKDLIKINADKIPIGGFVEDKINLFKNNVFQLQKEDTIYLFTDGYADQFGGEKGKKFKYKQLQELLISMQDQSMKQQKENLDFIIEKWKGLNEQTDDILIIGINV